MHWRTKLRERAPSNENTDWRTDDLYAQPLRPDCPDARIRREMLRAALPYVIQYGVPLLVLLVTLTVIEKAIFG